MAETITRSIRTEPHSLEAEAAVLGGILLHNDAMDLVADTLRPEDFFSERNRVLYSCMLQLHQKGSPLDPVVLLNSIQERSEDKKVDGVYISELADAIPSSANIVNHAEIVRKNAVLRNLITTCHTISDEAFTGVPDIEDFLDRAEGQFMRVAELRAVQGPQRIGDHLPEVFRKLEEQARSGRSLTGLDTGYFLLNDMTMGLQAGDLIILAARPSMGKTAFSLNLLHEAVSRSGRPGIFFSLEMPSESLIIRLICSQARVSSEDLRKGDFKGKPAAGRKVVEAITKLKDQPIFIDDSGSLTLMELRARCRRLKSAEKDLGLVVVDYLQLMQGDRSINSREQQISQISRGLKSLARELSVPVIALSQLNRQVEKRDDKRPTMSDLRESGAIEQDADLISFLYRDEVYNKESADAGKATVIIAKHRNGRIGAFDLKFFKEFGLFENLAPESDGFD